MSSSCVTQLFADLESNRSAAQQAVFDEYYQRMLGLVKKNIRGRLSRRLDASDVAMSAFRSFFRHAKDGDFNCEKRPQLWKLLATITINKLRNRVRYHKAARRSISEEVDEASPQLIEPAAQDLAIVNEEIEQTFAKLKPYHREIAERIFAGQPYSLIAAETQRSTRTVSRVGKELEKALVQRLIEPT